MADTRKAPPSTASDSGTTSSASSESSSSEGTSSAASSSETSSSESDQPPVAPQPVMHATPQRHPPRPHQMQCQAPATAPPGGGLTAHEALKQLGDMRTQAGSTWVAEVLRDTEERMLEHMLQQLRGAKRTASEALDLDIPPSESPRPTKAARTGASAGEGPVQTAAALLSAPQLKREGESEKVKRKSKKKDREGSKGKKSATAGEKSKRQKRDEKKKRTTWPAAAAALVEAEIRVAGEQGRLPDYEALRRQLGGYTVKQIQSKASSIRKELRYRAAGLPGAVSDEGAERRDAQSELPPPPPAAAVTTAVARKPSQSGAAWLPANDRPATQDQPPQQHDRPQVQHTPRDRGAPSGPRAPVIIKSEKVMGPPPGPAHRVSGFDNGDGASPQSPRAPQSQGRGYTHPMGSRGWTDQRGQHYHRGRSHSNNRQGGQHSHNTGKRRNHASARDPLRQHVQEALTLAPGRKGTVRDVVEELMSMQRFAAEDPRQLRERVARVLAANPEFISTRAYQSLNAKRVEYVLDERWVTALQGDKAGKPGGRV